MPYVSQKSLWIVYFVIFLDTLNFGILFPLLPSIAKSFGADAKGVGSLATAFSLAQLICTNFLGRASDKYGRRPVLLLSLFGTAVSSALTGAAWSLPVVLAARIINGASGASTGVANAYIADVTNFEERPIYLSYLSAANSLGIILGPALGGALSRFGFPTACYAAAGVAGVEFVLGIFFLAESKGAAARSPPLNAAANGNGEANTNAAPLVRSASTGSAANARVPCQAGWLFLSGFCLVLGFAATETVTGYYLMDKFFDGDEKKSGEFYGELFTIGGVAMFLVSVFVYRRLRTCIGEKKTCYLGALLRFVAFLITPWLPSKWFFAATTAVMIVSTTLIMPTTASLLTTMCHSSIYGKALAYSQSFQSLARIIAPVVFGALYDSVSHDIAFYVCAGSAVIAGLSIAAVPSPQPPAEPADACVEEGREGGLSASVATQEEIDANLDILERQMSAKGATLDFVDIVPALVRCKSARTIMRSASSSPAGLRRDHRQQTC
eukprot:TRINITY_DN6283_c0_g1_i2.p1 TRINITY_DN6283_c0_g1~~TRINITY_DN6283_c0_g1_i2.p1  ORF type:complete len:496 (-),score=72.51 TRINITY_DN6283_c0_g1_i2:366-1853(-)